MPLRSPETTWWGVVLGAPDAAALAGFYARLLGWQVYAAADDDGFVSVAPDETTGYNLACQTEPDYVRPVWPAGPDDQQMQLHLDLQVDDLDQAVAYAVECGAELAGFQPQERVRVMLDPAGHPFCLYL